VVSIFTYLHQIRLLAWVSLILLIVHESGAKNTTPEWLSMKGYIDFMETITLSEHSNEWISGTVGQNRLELSLHPATWLTVSSAMRTRLMYGTLYEQLYAVGYDKTLEHDPGLMDLTVNVWKNQSAVLNATLDRLYADFSAGDWQFRAGRHRINWGKNLVWTPNDLFNAYSVFDVSYEEGPGTDALLVRRYLGPMSQLEMVVEGAKDADSISVAALWQISRWGFDIQVLGGSVKSAIAAGMGFSGSLGGTALRGEFTLFSPETDSSRAQIVGSLSADYSFSNGLYIHASSLYNNYGAKRPSGELTGADFTSRLNARTLSPAMFQLYTQITYPITPLIHTDWSAILNPADGSLALMPVIIFSLAENVDVTIRSQLQIGSVGDQFSSQNHIVYGAFRWSF
jgi:hypothetical protein